MNIIEVNSPVRSAAAVICTQIFLHATTLSTKVLFSIAILQMGYSGFSVGLVLSAYSIGTVLTGPKLGRFIDRHNFAFTSKFAIVLSFIGMLIILTEQNVYTMAAAACIIGFGNHIGILSGQKFIGNNFHDPVLRKKAYTYYSTGPALSNMLSPLFAGLLIDTFGNQTAILGILVLPILSLLFSFFAQDRGIRSKSEPGHQSSLRFLKQPEVVPLLMFNLIAFFAWDIHNLIVPILGHEAGLSATAIGSVLTAFGVATLLARITLLIFNSRTNELLIILSSSFLIVFVLAAYPLTNNYYVWLCLAFLLGTALGSLQPMVITLMSKLVPQNTYGELLGLRLSMMNLSGLIMPSALGGLTAVISSAAIFWVGTAVELVGLKIIWGYFQSHRKSNKE